MINLTKYKGMSQKEIVSIVSNQFSSFLDSFKRPSNMIKVSEVEKEFERLETLVNDLKQLVSDEKSYWYGYREYNNCFSEWERVDNIICWYMVEANKYVSEIDWSKYER